MKFFLNVQIYYFVHGSTFKKTCLCINWNMDIMGFMVFRKVKFHYWLFKLMTCAWLFPNSYKNVNEMGLFVYARVNDGNGKVLKANPLDGMTFVSFHYVNHVSPIILVLAFSYAKHYVCILFYVFVCHL